MEFLILQQLDWRIRTPSPHTFLHLFSALLCPTGFRAGSNQERLMMAATYLLVSWLCLVACWINMVGWPLCWSHSSLPHSHSLTLTLTHTHFHTLSLTQELSQLHSAFLRYEYPTLAAAGESPEISSRA